MGGGTGDGSANPARSMGSTLSDMETRLIEVERGGKRQKLKDDVILYGDVVTFEGGTRAVYLGLVPPHSMMCFVSREGNTIAIEIIHGHLKNKLKSRGVE